MQVHSLSSQHRSQQSKKSRSTGICGVPSGVHVPKGNAVKIIDLEPASFATLLARVVTEIGARR